MERSTLLPWIIKQLIKVKTYLSLVLMLKQGEERSLRTEPLKLNQEVPYYQKEMLKPVPSPKICLMMCYARRNSKIIFNRSSKIMAIMILDRNNAFKF